MLIIVLLLLRIEVLLELAEVEEHLLQRALVDREVLKQPFLLQLLTCLEGLEEREFLNAYLEKKYIRFGLISFFFFI